MSKAAELAALIGSGQAQGNRNLIINGAMQVAQRGTSVADPSDGTYGSLDRFGFFNSNDGAFTISQETTVPSGEGFYNSMKFDCTTADGTIAAGQYATCFQNIEGLNNSILQYGTSDAKSIVVSFYAKSNLTGTFCYSVRNSAVDRSFIKEWSLASANTWERISFVIEGDTTGTWLGTNGIGSRHMISLSQGSTFSGGTNNAWQVGNKTATNNQVNFLSSTDNELFITGWQVEIGSGAPTAFEHEDFGTTLARCQRYYYKIGSGSVYQRFFMGSCQSSNYANGSVPFPVEMRATPSLESTGTANNYAVYAANSVRVCTSAPSISSTGSSTSVSNVSFGADSLLVAGQAGEMIANNNSSAYLAFSAEL